MYQLPPTYELTVYFLVSFVYSYFKIITAIFFFFWRGGDFTLIIVIADSSNYVKRSSRTEQVDELFKARPVCRRHAGRLVGEDGLQAAALSSKQRTLNCVAPVCRSLSVIHDPC